MSILIRLEQALERRPWIVTALLSWTLVMIGVTAVVLVFAKTAEPPPPILTLAQEREAVSPPPETPLSIAQRWSPVRLPAMPATLLSPVALVAVRPPQAVDENEPGTEVAAPVRVLQPAPRRARVAQKAEARGQLCARHGLRQVWVSSTRWRCKR